MKKQIIMSLTIALTALFLTFSSMAMALEAGDPLSQEIVITGMIEKQGDTFILKEADGYQYTITNEDLSDIVGEKVQATGELIVDENENRFNVNTIVVLPDKKSWVYEPFEAGHH